ncbi:MAG: hypothetical protein M3132_12605 [Actinomycetia bacterium]|nr:hypothetical protein [Actinomycetes bacterium]
MDNYRHIGNNSDLIVRFIHGTADTIVPLELTGAFNEALVEAGYDSELIAIEGGRHQDPVDPTTEMGIAALDQLAALLDLASS